MKPGSILFMSGFYVEDIPAIEAAVKKSYPFKTFTATQLFLSL